MSGLPTPRLRICNNPKCLTEFVSASRQAFYCPECHRVRRNAAKRERERLQRESDPDAVREKRERYYATHGVERRKYWRTYYENHRDKCIARSTQWQQENAESHRESARRYKQKVAEQRLAQNTPVTAIKKTSKQKNQTKVSHQTTNEILSAQIKANLKKWETTGEMRFCERMRVRALTLPCGQRDECYNGIPCPHTPEMTRKQRRKLIDLIWQ